MKTKRLTKAALKGLKGGLKQNAGTTTCHCDSVTYCAIVDKSGAANLAAKKPVLEKAVGTKKKNGL